MDQIVRGARLGFAYGDIEFALANAKVGINVCLHIKPDCSCAHLTLHQPQLYITRIPYCGTKKSEIKHAALIHMSFWFYLNYCSLFST